jgi:hypothetical protein
MTTIVGAEPQEAPAAAATPEQPHMEQAERRAADRAMARLPVQR